MNCTRPHVLISAASSGIGRASALHLADSADRSGSLRPSPAAMLSLVPCTFSRTSWPRALYRVLETTCEAAAVQGQHGRGGVYVAELAEPSRVLVRLPSCWQPCAPITRRPGTNCGTRWR